jgi:peptidoglycan hydrolase-like protein with peptidoglycan-binding domain
VAAMSDPILEPGARGEAVKKAQKELIRRYYLPSGSDDGVFGDVTRKSVIQYQLDRSAKEFYAYSFALPINGVVGPETWFRLAPDLIEKEAKGNGVRLLQEILKSLGGPFDPGRVDGDFGGKTEKAVKEFQRKFSDYDGNPLADDGDVGPITWRALWS